APGGWHRGAQDRDRRPGCALGGAHRTFGAGTGNRSPPPVSAAARRPTARFHSMIWSVRRGTLEDLPAIASLHRECFADAWDVAFLGRLLVQPGAFSVIAVEGLPAGFLLARVTAGEAEILSLGVRPSSRRRSLGTALVQDAMEDASLAGATEVF